MSFAGTWMELEVIILSEVTLEWKTKYFMFSQVGAKLQLHKDIQSDTMNIRDSEGGGQRGVRDKKKLYIGQNVD